MGPSSSFGPLLSPPELASQLSSEGLRIIDIRWSLADPDGGRARYEQAHIPGAAFVDLDRDITGSTGAGRHPLPTREQFERAMRTAGVRRGDRVVIYDDGGGSVAARVWWLLRVYGHEAAAVLNGGIQAWPGPFESGIVNPVEGDFVAAAIDRSAYLDRNQVAALGSGTVLIDVRAPERYAGETEPVDPVAGHIPGAVNVFWQDNLGPDGRFLPADELRHRYEVVGVGEGGAVVYCGSGVNASQAVLALELARLPVRLYAGSWSDWCSHEGAPVATGR